MHPPLSWALLFSLLMGCLFAQAQPSPEIPIESLSQHPIRSLEVNDLEYYFIEKGEGDLIFFLHGFPDMAGTWDETISELSKDYRCVAPFLRGYYPTALPKDGDYSARSIARDIDQIARKLGVEHYSVVGQDWGALVTYAMASLFPERVDKIATIAIPHPSCIRTTPTTAYKARHFIRFRNQKKSPAYTRKDNFAYLDKLYTRWSPNWAAYTETADLIKRAYSLPGRLEAALGYYWSLNQQDKSQPDLYEKMPEMPWLALAGRTDGALPMGAFKRMEKRVETPFWMVYHDEAGHFLHAEAPKFFVETLKAFLE